MEFKLLLLYWYAVAVEEALNVKSVIETVLVWSLAILLMTNIDNLSKLIQEMIITFVYSKGTITWAEWQRESKEYHLLRSLSSDI